MYASAPDNVATEWCVERGSVPFSGSFAWQILREKRCKTILLAFSTDFSRSLWSFVLLFDDFFCFLEALKVFYGQDEADKRFS